jgi:hypothetical protein
VDQIALVIFSSCNDTANSRSHLDMLNVDVFSVISHYILELTTFLKYGLQTIAFKHYATASPTLSKDRPGAFHRFITAIIAPVENISPSNPTFISAISAIVIITRSFRSLGTESG